MISLKSIAREFGLSDQEAAAILEMDLEGHDVNGPMAEYYRALLAPHQKTVPLQGILTTEMSSVHAGNFIRRLGDNGGDGGTEVVCTMLKADRVLLKLNFANASSENAFRQLLLKGSLKPFGDFFPQF